MKLKLNIKISLLLIAAGLLGACSSAPPPQQAELPTAPSTQNAVEVTAPAAPTPSPTVASTEATGPTPANPTLANPTPVNNDTSNSGGSVQDVAPTTSASADLVDDFSNETVGGEPTSFVPAVGYWSIGVDGDNQVLVVDGRQWEQGQTSAGIAEQARTLYGERYAEFLDNVKAYAYYPFAVAQNVEDFSNGEIRVRFKPIEGRIDQAAGIVFGLQPNGDYYTVRANGLENNLVLWRVVHGERSSLQWVRDTPAVTNDWHELKVVIDGSQIKSSLDGQPYLEYTFPAPVSGKVGLWSKADSVVYFDDFKVTPGKN